jgi:hypothetical protein
MTSKYDNLGFTDKCGCGKSKPISFTKCNSCALNDKDKCACGKSKAKRYARCPSCHYAETQKRNDEKVRKLKSHNPLAFQRSPPKNDEDEDRANELRMLDCMSAGYTEIGVRRGLSFSL